MNRLIITILTCLVSAVSFGSKFEKAETDGTVAILVAMRDLEAGATISKRAIGTMRIPEKEFAENYYTTDDLEHVLNKSITIPIKRKEILTTGHFENRNSATLAPSEEIAVDPNIQETLLEDGKKAEQALEQILEKTGSTTAEDLFMATGSALNQERYADAAYLFYIAKFRVEFDKELFPPVGTGGNSPMVAFGALSFSFGQVVNPEIMRRPDEFTKALKRTKNWKPLVPEGYDPGWEYTAKQDISKATENLEEIRREFNNGMGGLASLLNKPEYFSSFKIVQAYNMTFDESRPSKEKYDEAVAKMTQIEKDSGLEGMFYTPEEK